MGIRVATIGATPKRTSGRNTASGQIADVLNTSGMYSMVRHPLYLGNFFIVLGISLFVRSWLTTLVVLLVFFIYYERRMFAEEEFLRRKFGTAYLEWAACTPAFIPRFANWRSPSLQFSLRKALRREYSGFFAIVASFTLLEILSDFFVEGKLELDPMWVVIFVVGLIAYTLLRTLKKKSSLLSDRIG
jgi:protein-S-isoprenylcysteine O-methyltransferase Ste14